MKVAALKQPWTTVCLDASELSLDGSQYGLRSPTRFSDHGNSFTMPHGVLD